MGSKFWITGRITLGLLTGAVCALPQAYTISAKPGAVNYIEGPAAIDGKPITANAKRVFVGANQTLETASGSKAEMLLTPGVFVRLGSASSVKMITPSLTDTKVEVARGEVVVEVAELEKDNQITVIDHGVATNILKVGLYRFTADPAIAQVLEGKASVLVGDRKVELGKDHELALADGSKSQKFPTKSTEDDLYAWSKVRDEYVSAASYSAAKNIGSGGNSAMDYGYSGMPYSGFGGYYGPGWFWNSGWNSFAWVPGEGAFFSPFGFGYYSPYSIGYAPVVYLPINGMRPVPVPVIPGKPIAVAGGGTAKPVIPNAPRGFASNSMFAGQINNGHISSAALAHSAGSASHASGGGYSGGAYSGGGGRAIASASAPMSSAGGHASAPSGGGGHK